MDGLRLFTVPFTVLIEKSRGVLMSKRNYELLKIRVVRLIQEDVLTASNEKGVSWWDKWNDGWADNWSNFDDSKFVD